MHNQDVHIYTITKEGDNQLTDFYIFSYLVY